jgi:glutamate N-acetyltransferase / amino-acid N-acetyltransferase
MKISGVKGFRVAGVNCGLKRDPAALDFALIVSDHDCTAAGMFTTNQVKAAPVLFDQQVLASHADQIRAVAINAGCANACTGEQGYQAAQHTADWVKERFGGQALVMSTGVIGTHLPLDKIKQGIDTAANQLGEDWDAAARAIMTTDTRPKTAAVTVTTMHGSYTVAGIAKGAGMIAPNMATMLGVIVTDAKLNREQSRTLLQSAVKDSFNRVVVDGDMSTNDTVLLLANGASGVIIQDDEAERELCTALEVVCRHLAQAIVRDGEGASKFITLNITGAVDDTAAHTIANTIATSPLVKTAFYGGDPNWGRIIAAAGRTGVIFEPDRAKLWIMAGEHEALTDGAQLLFEAGKPTDYDENHAKAIMNEASLTVSLDCGTGTGWATVWTCDLSHDYVSVNGHYRT